MIQQPPARRHLGIYSCPVERCNILIVSLRDVQRGVGFVSGYQSASVASLAKGMNRELGVSRFQEMWRICLHPGAEGHRVSCEYQNLMGGLHPCLCLVDRVEGALLPRACIPPLTTASKGPLGYSTLRTEARLRAQNRQDLSRSMTGTWSTGYVALTIVYKYNSKVHSHNEGDEINFQALATGLHSYTGGRPSMTLGRACSECSGFMRTLSREKAWCLYMKIVKS